MVLLNMVYKVLHRVLHLPCTAETGASSIRMVFTSALCACGEIFMRRLRATPEEPLIGKENERTGTGTPSLSSGRSLLIFSHTKTESPQL